MGLVTLLEELSLNAYPGAQQLHYDGWVLQVSPGRWRRANSVQALHPSTRPLDEKIAVCEAFYAARARRTIFKLTRESPPGLEDRLAERGYTYDGDTSVYTAELRGPAPLASFAEVELLTEPTPDYAEAFYRIHHFAEADRAPWLQIQRAILPPMVYLGLRAGGEIVAVAIGVVERGWLGVFGVGVADDQRRRGHARRIMAALAAWGAGLGATHSYLQVMRDNPAALALYAGLGYREVYGYWYRQKG